MTKFIEWDRFTSMTSRQRANINTATTFTEQRSTKEKEAVSKDFGMKKLAEEINVEWPDEN